MHIAWSANGTQVATAGDDDTLRTWDAVAGQEKFVMSGHREVIVAVEFSGDGQRLLSGDARGTIKLWDVATGVETLTLRGSIGQMAAAGWSPDGKRIFGNCDGKIVIWDATTSYQQ
jgi:WD40 repeat protein